MFPVFPEVLNLPSIPNFDLEDAVAARLAFKTESGVFSTNPAPNNAVGILKTTFFAFS
jgi:hypothetical protein